MNKQVSIDASVTTNTGLVRPNNEDNFYLNGSFMRESEQSSNISLSIAESNNEFIYAVCDGMGGEEAGEKASLAAVSELKKFHEKSIGTASPGDISYLTERLNLYIDKTNKHINELSLQGGYSMGTTFAALAIWGDQAAALNLGDTRVYLKRNGTLRQLTKDHTEAQRLIRLGVLTNETARNHKSRYQLYRHLGISLEEGKLEADISEILTINKGDLFIICSDGLTDMLEDGIILDMVSRDLKSIDIAGSLVDSALKNGGMDNVTVMILKIEDIY